MDMFAALGAKRPSGSTEGAKTDSASNGGTSSADSTKQNTSSGSGTTEQTNTTNNQPTDETAVPENVAQAEKDGVDGGGVADGKDGGQSKEERAENARRRREQEGLAREEKARQEERRKLDAMIVGLGLTDLAGKPVKTVEDMTRYQRERDRAEAYAEIKRIGGNPEAMEKLINSHPAVFEARQLKAEGQRAEQRGLESSAKAIMDERLANIQKFDPSIKSYGDLKAHQSFSAVEQYVRENNLPIDKAFELANSESLRQKAQAVAKQATLNSVNGKGHMQPTPGQQGALSDIVPADVAAAYRKITPNITNDQIKEKYQRMVNKQKK